MRPVKKIAVALDLQDPLPEVYQDLKNYEFIRGAEVHFVYSFTTTNYAFGLGETAWVFPVDSDRKKLEESVVEMLNDISRSLFPKDFCGSLRSHCLFSDNPKAKFCEFAQQEKIDMIVVATREKKGIFDSSFTHYLTKHTHSNVLILKQKNAKGLI